MTNYRLSWTKLLILTLLNKFSFKIQSKNQTPASLDISEALPWQGKFNALLSKSPLRLKNLLQVGL